MIFSILVLLLRECNELENRVWEMNREGAEGGKRKKKKEKSFLFFNFDFLFSIPTTGQKRVGKFYFFCGFDFFFQFFSFASFLEF